MQYFEKFLIFLWLKSGKKGIFKLSEIQNIAFGCDYGVFRHFFSHIEFFQKIYFCGLNQGKRVSSNCPKYKNVVFRSV